jgi:KDO2-lipid IV(A) lauroyltransferase
MNNLKIAFPEKTEAERKIISKKFYRNLTDTVVETVKLVTGSVNIIKRRSKADWSIVSDLEKTGRSIQVHIGHNFNWEWVNAMGKEVMTIPRLAVYMPLSSKVFDRFFHKLRAKYGTILIRATHMRQDFAPYRNKQYILGLIADQNPGNPSNAWWFNFFGKPTPFLKGPARAAIAGNFPVVFGYIHKPRRGYYTGEIFVATMNPAEMNEQELTGLFVRYLEKKIREHPEMWLWSHRRWKHEWKPEYGPIVQ